MRKDLDVLREKLGMFEWEYWSIKECPDNCDNWISRTPYTRECSTCDGKSYILPKPKAHPLFITIDLACTESKDDTCIGTWKKNDDWTIELVTMKYKKK